jgi:hypothetical protein
MNNTNNADIEHQQGTLCIDMNTGRSCATRLYRFMLLPLTFLVLRIAFLNDFLNSFNGDCRFKVERIISDRTIPVDRILALSDGDELVRLYLENVGGEEAVKKCLLALMFARELRAASSLPLPLEIAQSNAADASTTDSSISIMSMDSSGGTSNVAMESVAQGNSVAESMETSNTMNADAAGH